MGTRTIKKVKVILSLSLILSCSANKVGLKLKECERIYLEGRINDSALCSLSGEKEGPFLFAMILADKGYYSRAKRLLEEELSANNPIAHFVMGYVYYREGDIDSAERELVSAEESGMRNADLYLLLSFISVDKCKKNEAIFYEKKLKEVLKAPNLEFLELQRALKRCSP